jgi:hypothetical protein
MQRQKKVRATAQARPRKDRAAERVLRSANGFIVGHYPFGCLGKSPQRLVGNMYGTLRDEVPSDLWIVPVFFTSPGYGAVGEVGLVAIDARSHQVVGATERRRVNRAIKHLKESKRDELEAAFHRSRTA